MPIFFYKGRDQSGALKSGKRMANSPDNLSAQLIQENIFPIVITEEVSKVSVWNNFSRLFRPLPTPDELAIFARQMYTLTKTGVPLAGSLRNLANNMNNKRMAEALYGIVDQLEGGKDFATSMDNFPDVFSPMIVSLVRVGQSSGRLAEAFLNINQYLEAEANSERSMRTAMRYPIFVTIALTAAIIIINVFVIPSFARVFEQANVALPLPTLIFIATSHFIIHYWYVVLGIFALMYYSFQYYVRTPKGRFNWDRIRLKIPIFGKMIRRIIMLRFAQSFSITMKSGVPLIEGIELVAQSIENKYAQFKILSMREGIEHGKTLTQSAGATDLFSGLELQMLNVSEETGELSAMLDQIAAFYQREVDYDLKRLNDIIEPVLILVLGAVVLVLALAVYLPVWNIAKAAKLG